MLATNELLDQVIVTKDDAKEIRGARPGDELHTQYPYYAVTMAKVVLQIQMAGISHCLGFGKFDPYTNWMGA